MKKAGYRIKFFVSYTPYASQISFYYRILQINIYLSTFTPVICVKQNPEIHILYLYFSIASSIVIPAAMASFLAPLIA